MALSVHSLAVCYICTYSTEKKNRPHFKEMEMAWAYLSVPAEGAGLDGEDEARKGHVLSSFPAPPAKYE